MNSEIKNPTNKLLGLEAVRFICALSVVFWHYQHFFYAPHQPSGFVAEHQPLYSVLRPVYEFGLFGVPVFWCISGFIFFWKYRLGIADRRVGPRKFFILRFSRLYPLHFATLLLVALLQAAYVKTNGVFFIYPKNDPLHFLLQLFMASNWAATNTAGDSFNGPIWSISIEVMVYAFFFLTLRHVGRSAWINIGIVIACLAAKALKVPSPIVDCLAYFYAGGLSAMLLQQAERVRLHRAIMIGAAAAVLLIPSVLFLTGLNQQKHFTFLFLVTYTPLVLFVCAHDIHVHPLVHRIVEAAGNMTYSSYLIHFPIQLAMALYFSRRNEPIPCEQVTFLAAFVFGTLIAAYYIYRCFEVPAQDCIRRRYR